MRIMNARNFRTQFPTLEEAVIVISKEKVIGTWSPTAPDAEREAVEGMLADLMERYPKTAAQVKPAQADQAALRYDQRPLRAVPKK